MLRRLCKLLGFKPSSFIQADRKIIFDQGNTVPTDATAGYAVGCLFLHRDGGEGTALYINEGSETSCDFNAVAALTAAQEALLGAVAGTVTASTAVIVDANKDIGDFRNVDAVNIDAGASGVAGTVDVFPTTASKGKNAYTGVDNTGDTVNTIRNVAMAGARTLEYPDPGLDGATKFKLRALPERYRLEWTAGQRGKPSLNGDIQNAAEATRMIADPDFEILGTNASSDDVTFNAEGGIVMQTDGADGDEVILLPHLDANQSAWTQVTWGTDQSTRWECRIKSGSAITNSIIWAGLKLTNTEVTATDDDQVFFRYEDGVNTGKWQAISSIAGTDSADDSGVTVAVDTDYHLVIDIAADRTAKFYINGVLVKTSTALTATDLIPYIGIATDGAAEAKSLIVRGQAIERNFA